MNQVRFIEEALEQEIAERGFAVRDLLKGPSLEALVESSKAFYGQIQAEPSLRGRFLSAGRFQDPSSRLESVALIKQWLVPALESCFTDDSVRVVSGVHQIKPPGGKSRLNPHQDSSHVDERFEMAYYAWVPLMDTTAKNGALQVIPGSHKLGIPQRSLSVPWPLRHPLHQVLLRLFSIPLSVRAGQVVFFHSALIHGSGPNQTEEVRLAVNSLILPGMSVYRHFFRDENTPRDQVEVYGVSPEFFYKEDILARPSHRWTRLTNEPWQDQRVTVPRLFSFLLRQYKHYR